ALTNRAATDPGGRGPTRPRTESAHEPNRRARKAKRARAQTNRAATDLRGRGPTRRNTSQRTNRTGERGKRSGREPKQTEPRPTCAGAARPGEKRVSSRTEPASAESEAGAKPQQTEPSAESEAGAKPKEQSRRPSPTRRLR